MTAATVILSDVPVVLDEYQLATLAQAHMDQKSELIERLTETWDMLRGDWEYLKKKNWVKLLVMHAIIKEYGLPDMGI